MATETGSVAFTADIVNALPDRLDSAMDNKPDRVKSAKLFDYDNARNYSITKI